MTLLALRQQLTADASHTIHFTLPPEMSAEVEVIILPRAGRGQNMPPEAMAMAQVMDETGFAQRVLNSPEEDCWNEL
jgi:hypothetical protein